MENHGLKENTCACIIIIIIIILILNDIKSFYSLYTTYIMQHGGHELQKGVNQVNAYRHRNVYSPWILLLKYTNYSASFLPTANHINPVSILHTYLEGYACFYLLSLTDAPRGIGSDVALMMPFVPHEIENYTKISSHTI